MNLNDVCLKTARLYIKGEHNILNIYDLTNNNIGTIEYKGNGEKVILVRFEIKDEYQNKGYMTEAIREVIKYLFLELKVEEVKSIALGEKGIRVLQKNNFNTESMFPYLEKNNYLSTLEQIKLYDKISLNPADIWVYRGAKIPEGFYRGVVDIVIKNNNDNKFLLTRRDRNKETYPNMLETTGGSVSFGEDECAAAIREVKEETGLEIKNIRFISKKTIRSAIYFLYYAEVECNSNDVVLQPGETCEYMWLDKEEYLKLWQSEGVVRVQKERITDLLDMIKEW